jgi:hypothetical protein
MSWFVMIRFVTSGLAYGALVFNDLGRVHDTSVMLASVKRCDMDGERYIQVVRDLASVFKTAKAFVDGCRRKGARGCVATTASFEVSA